MDSFDYALGVVVGAFVGGFVSFFLTSVHYDQPEKQKCERDLARNVECVWRKPEGYDENRR